MTDYDSPRWSNFRYIMRCVSLKPPPPPLLDLGRDWMLMDTIRISLPLEFVVCGYTKGVLSFLSVIYCCLLMIWIFGVLISMDTLLPSPSGGSLTFVVTHVFSRPGQCALVSMEGLVFLEPNESEIQEELCGFLINFSQPDPNHECSRYLFQCNTWRDQWRVECILNNYPHE